MAEPDVSQSNVHERSELSFQRGDGTEEGVCFFDGHVEHIVDGGALIANVERLAVVTLAFADITCHVHIG